MQKAAYMLISPAFIRDFTVIHEVQSTYRTAGMYTGESWYIREGRGTYGRVGVPNDGQWSSRI